MLKMSEYSYIAGMLSVVLSIAFYVIAYASVRVASRRTAVAGGAATMDGGTTMQVVAGPSIFASYGTLVAWLAFIFLVASMTFRAIVTGHGPFSNMYEFSIAFATGVIGVYLFFERKYHQQILGLIVLPIALLMLLYAWTIPATADPLVPALQNNLLLSVHVAVAIVAYGTFAVSFAAAVLYLLQAYGVPRLPKAELLDEIGYRAVVIGFPFMTLVIVLGAVWANVAWGRYWGWDPKETASLVTWLIYGAYLHARVVRGWRGNRAAWLLVIGFGATLFTYFGNLFFGGLHSYSGLG
jgi:cytochrome c-type biogenesis protein CcsB